MLDFEKRKWCYAGAPASYGIPGCACGCNTCEYSEYVDCLWCPVCQIDFTPSYWGIFDGPILFEVAQGLGMNFDRINLVKNVYEQFDGFDKNGEAIVKELTNKEEITARLLYLELKHKKFLDEMGVRG